MAWLGDGVLLPELFCASAPQTKCGQASTWHFYPLENEEGAGVWPALLDISAVKRF